MAAASPNPIAPSEHVFVALGANLGEPEAQVRAAMGRLDRLSVRPVRRSSLWLSTPVDCPPGSPSFVNAVVEVFPRTGETPIDWLEHLQALEREFGRRPKVLPNESRPLDLDLIAWGERRYQEVRLILPHPRAPLRRFVLEPLSELTPDYRAPGWGATVAELLALLPADPGWRRLGPG